MRSNASASLLALLFCASVALPAAAQTGAGKGNSSSSAGASNADVMAPGATGATTPNGAGDVSASGASNAKSTPHKAKHRKSKAKKPAPGAESSSQQ